MDKLCVLLILALLMAGCAGSPRVVVNKNIEVHIDGQVAQPGDTINPYFPFPIYVNIEYKTESSTPVEAEIEQKLDAEDAFKASR